MTEQTQGRLRTGRRPDAVTGTRLANWRFMNTPVRTLLLALALTTTGCFSWPVPQARNTDDAASVHDAASPIDAGMDGGADAGMDAATQDDASIAVGTDTGPASSFLDSGHHDANVDSGFHFSSPDAGSCCVSGHIGPCLCDASAARSCSASYTSCPGDLCYVGTGTCG
jgi:hypothetical protein